jgi:hypothetical protein
MYIDVGFIQNLLNELNASPGELNIDLFNEFNKISIESTRIGI